MPRVYVQKPLSCSGDGGTRSRMDARNGGRVYLSLSTKALLVTQDVGETGNSGPTRCACYYQVKLLWVVADQRGTVSTAVRIAVEKKR